MEGVGLGTFNKELDDDTKVEVEWYELKKAGARQGTEPWPKNPIFRQTCLYRGSSRQVIGMKKSVESLADFLNVQVTQTAKSDHKVEPRLAQAAIRALALHAPHLRRHIEVRQQQRHTGRREEEGEGSGEESEEESEEGGSEEEDEGEDGSSDGPSRSENESEDEGVRAGRLRHVPAEQGKGKRRKNCEGSEPVEERVVAGRKMRSRHR